ncbi:ABC transporter ATP-binding protein [Cellulomonas denverensis]|uniref:ABC transporter ATP-binding protein n=1 Tax=Cellulomonas denverensis TaxID=264297 RepID=A0A7X6KT78_9CELL|nr:ABC transporter ATP-binding protein [Cellulomonas denverensis]NKY21529.1 ABC transporter ATP-binding protein [Cellulomonas denverensis]GIG25420.1 ABC transporter ATPase [Cellulomonas denverensis]
MIEVRGLSAGYGPVPVLHGVDLTAPDGKVLGLLGPNGSGKTTLLRCLYGGLRPAAGDLRLDGEDLARLSVRDLARRVAVVVQEHGDDPPMPVAQMVLLGRTPHHRGPARTTREDLAIATDALCRVGGLHLADREFADLSGGERQRVLLARALTQSAGHLLLDEPTNHLDVRYQHEVLDLVRRLGVTVVVVLHDLNLAAAYCDRVLLLADGRVRAAGTPAEVLVPEVLEPVYRLTVRRMALDDGFQLAFRPAVS